MQNIKKIKRQLFNVFISDVSLDKMLHNGKSICEGRAKLDKKFNFDRTKQIAFSDC